MEAAKPIIKTDYYKSKVKESNLETYKGLVSHALPGLHKMVTDMLAEARGEPNNAKVFDLAAGQGALSARLSDAGYSVTACDYVQENFAAADFGVKFMQLDLNKDFSNNFEGSADILCAVEIIEHIENPRHFLRECKKLLSDNGKLVITTPNIDSARSKIDFVLEGTFHMFRDSSYRSSGHITPISNWQLEKMIEETGMRVIKHNTYGREDYSFNERPKAFLAQQLIKKLGRKYPWGDGAIHVLLLSV